MRDPISITVHCDYCPNGSISIPLHHIEECSHCVDELIDHKLKEAGWLIEDREEICPTCKEMIEQ